MEWVRFRQARLRERVGVFTSVVAGSGTAALPSYSFVGDTDTGMFWPAANTLAWSAGGTEGVRLDSSGNLGIGTSSPATKLHINTGAAGYGVTIAASSQTGITYQLGIDSNSNLAIYDTSAAAQRLVLSPTGLLQLAAGNTGGGVALNNAANTSPTVLDWYEEGTFTPTLTGIGTPTYTTQSGSYTRIGNVVHFNITLNWTGGTNGAGITVASLPFTAAGVNTPVSVSVNYLGNASFTWTGVVKAYVSGGTANIALVVESSGASNGALLNPSAGTKDVIISGTYRVA